MCTAKRASSLRPPCLGAALRQRGFLMLLQNVHASGRDVLKLTARFFDTAVIFKPRIPREPGNAILSTPFMIVMAALIRFLFIVLPFLLGTSCPRRGDIPSSCYEGRGRKGACSDDKVPVSLVGTDLSCAIYAEFFGKHLTVVMRVALALSFMSGCRPR